MRERLLKQSWSYPTPENPDHRKAAHFTVYQEYCDRHELETSVLPIAEAAGWPLAPNFDRLYIRILKLQKSLEEDILDASQDKLDTNVFLNKVLKQHNENSSSLAAEGIRTQCETYDSAEAGAG